MRGGRIYNPSIDDNILPARYFLVNCAFAGHSTKSINSKFKICLLDTFNHGYPSVILCFSRKTNDYQI